MAQTTLPSPPDIGPLFTVNFKSIRLTDAQFEQLCSDNRDLRLELTFEGELIVMPPAGSKTGLRNARLNQKLGNWADIDGTGVLFDSSSGFTLPNGSKYSPDSAWIRRDRWDALTNEEQEGFAPVCPDFVIELRSHSDSLSRLRNKMQEYIETALTWPGSSIRSSGRFQFTGNDMTSKCLRSGDCFGRSLAAGFYAATGRRSG